MPPQVLWTNPSAEAEAIVGYSTSIFTDTLGPAYSPVILTGVSKPLSETTVRCAMVTLTPSGGAPVASTAQFDPATNQIVLTPRAGNPLAEPSVWQLTAASRNGQKIHLPLVIRDA